MMKLKTRLIANSERTASLGKFRLVILIDGDFYQVEGDFDTFEEAFKFGSDRVRKGEFLAIYDDKGVALNPRLYRGGFYKIWSEQEIIELADVSFEDLRAVQKSMIYKGDRVTAGRLGMVIQMAEAELARIKEKK